jgi:hypothetical protein
MDWQQEKLAKKDRADSKRNRVTLTVFQKTMLEEVWIRTKFPSREERESLASRSKCHQTFSLVLEAKEK